MVPPVSVYEYRVSSKKWRVRASAGSTNGITVDAVQVANCCSLPCYFTNGQNASFAVVFTAGISHSFV